MSEELSPPKDLTDPATLIAECEHCISGLDLQVQQARGFSAMGGVPQPEYFYSRTATLLRALKARLAAEAAPKPPEPDAKPPKGPARGAPVAGAKEQP